MPVLQNLTEFENCLQASQTQMQVIFKFSTACMNSIYVNNNAIPVLQAKYQIWINTRQIDKGFSDQISALLGIHHKTPQLLLIRNRVVEKVLSHEECYNMAIINTL